MILDSLEIENFRQFRGLHRFEPQPNGVVAIIGNNGAGKTTLFEAIEWCLYQPSRIRGEELPPRGDLSLRPRVRICLSNPLTGLAYEIERTLKKSSAVAEIIEKGPNGERAIIATGSTTVSAYNASKLIGLSHRAFVATFFTRQKELSFFGSFKPTERRREVGKLLGLETIRTAQESIAEERTAKRHVHQGLQAQYDHESSQRDFDAERADLLTKLTEIDAEVTRRSADVVVAETAYREAANTYSLLVEEREAALKLKAQRDSHEMTLKQIDTDLERTTRELERIAGLESERPRVAETAATVGAVGVEVDQLEATREKYERARSLREQRQQIIDERGRIVAAVHEVSRTEDGTRSLRDDDDLGWIDAQLAASSAVDTGATERLLEDLRTIHAAQDTCEALGQDIERFRSAVDKLTAEADALEVNGSPEQQEADLSEQRDRTVRSRAAIASNIETLTAVVSDLEGIVAHDHASLGDSVCPTCLRAFTPAELEQSRAALQERMDSARGQIAASKTEITRLDAEIKTIDDRLTCVRTMREELLRLRERIGNGLAKIAETENKRTTVEGELTRLKAQRNLTAPIGENDLAQVRTQLDRERTLEQTRTMLKQSRDTLVRLVARDAELAANLQELGPVDFEPALLAAARKRQDAARSALERLTSLDQQLALKQELLDSQLALASRRTEAQTVIAEMDAKLESAPLDVSFIDRASMDMDAVNQRVRQVQAQLDQQKRTRDQVDRELTQIDKDQKRLAEVAARADQARIEADDLDHMYRDFNAFEQFVARRVRPQLEDMTSELVRVITENKYEAIELDDDYGIKVWDGDVGSYPIEHFSGGERDVIALSARLALSRLIGSQAANPPSFMVLDEVFGSLDRERRANVLDLLSNLAGSAESFQQLFVISHVDDVRLSPAFTEVWRVSERSDGSSQLENLNLTMGSEDL